MSRPVFVEADASAELEEAARWYERQHPGLGVELLAAVNRAIEHLSMWPDAGSPVAGVTADLPVRQVPVSRFPYHVCTWSTPTQSISWRSRTIIADLATGIPVAAHDVARPASARWRCQR